MSDHLSSCVMENYGGIGNRLENLLECEAGQSGASFEIFPCFPSLTFTDRAERVERDRKRKALFSEYLTGRTV